MKKMTVALMMLLCTGFAAAQSAQTPQDAELLSAQIAYRQALKNHTDQSGRIQSIQERLENAKQRLQAAQADAQRAEQELAAAQSAQSTAGNELQAAGARLDAAWAAARGRQ